jgi:hypothetical protein
MGLLRGFEAAYLSHIRQDITQCDQDITQCDQDITQCDVCGCCLLAVLAPCCCSEAHAELAAAYGHTGGLVGDPQAHAAFITASTSFFTCIWQMTCIAAVAAHAVLRSNSDCGHCWIILLLISMTDSFQCSLALSW